MKKNIISIGVLILVLLILGHVYTQKNTLQKQAVVSVPEKNTVYLGEYNNKPTVFWTDGTEANVYKGHALSVGDTDFKNLVKPQRVYAFAADSVEGPTSFIFNKNKNTIYLTFNHHVYDTTVPHNPSTEIIGVDLNNHTDSVVWKSTGLNLTPNGPVFLTGIYSDMYISAIRAGCYACGGSAGGLLLVNLLSGKYTQIADNIGNMQVDLNKNSFSYQKKISVCKLTNSCDPTDPYPDTKPYGKVFTEKLP